MHLSDAEMLSLRRFCQEITYRPRSLDSQPCQREGKSIWCEDWEMIEVLKYLFLGAQTYFAELPPRRLRNNPLWSKESIQAKAEKMYEDFGGDIDAMIGRMRGARDGSA